MVAEADLTADDRVRLDDGAPRNPRLRGDDHALADLHVVPDLHEVINLRPAPDARHPERRAVDARVRADLHAVLNHHAADLRELVVNARLVAHVAEPVRADDDARVQDDRARENLRALAYLSAFAYTDTRADVNAFAYLRA